MGNSKHPCLSENLKKLLEQQRLRVSTLARETQTKHSTIHGYLNGVTPQSVTILCRLADYFGITIDELLFGFTDTDHPAATASDEVTERYQVTIEVRKERPYRREK